MSLNRQTETHDPQFPIGEVRFVILLLTPCALVSSRNTVSVICTCAVPISQACFLYRKATTHKSAFIYPEEKLARSSTCYATRRHIPDSTALIRKIRKVKVKVKFKFTLQQAMNAHRTERGTALLFFDLDARWGLVVNATPQQKDSVRTVQGGGVGLGAHLGRVRKI